MKREQKAQTEQDGFAAMTDNLTDSSSSTKKLLVQSGKSTILIQYGGLLVRVRITNTEFRNAVLAKLNS